MTMEQVDCELNCIDNIDVTIIITTIMELTR